MMIARIDPLLAARHAFATSGEHLTRVLFPDSESIELLFAGEIAILNQLVGRRVVRLRMFNFVAFGLFSARHGGLLKTIGFRAKSKRLPTQSGSDSLPDICGVLCHRLGSAG